MYDFYKNPPETKQDLQDYLTSWLQNVDNVTPLILHDETFIQEKGFKRAFHSHCVFRSLATNEYVWWVCEEYDLERFPIKRFPTYESMLESVINEYYVAWKLHG